MKVSGDPSNPSNSHQLSAGRFLVLNGQFSRLDYAGRLSSSAKLILVCFPHHAHVVLIVKINQSTLQLCHT